MKSTIPVHRNDITLLPDSARVILRPFILSSTQRVAAIIGRALALTEQEVEQELLRIKSEFDTRHIDIEELLLQSYKKIESHTFTHRKISCTFQKTALRAQKGLPDILAHARAAVKLGGSDRKAASCRMRQHPSVAGNGV